ncbi:MAG: hypothetical protein AAF696_12575 [Bacteroidota bacterium]
MDSQKITTTYILTGIMVVFLTWVSHEFAHWITAELMGYESIMRLNSVSQVEGVKTEGWHKISITAAGVIWTIIQGFIFFIILNRGGWNKYLYLFLFTAFFMRLAAGIMNLVSLNDEGRISEFLGIGAFTLPIIVSGLLFFMVYKISRKYSLKAKFQAWTFLIITLASSALILIDQFFKIRLL